jgi:hypothetical protein
MKLLIKGDMAKIDELCKEMTKIKEDEKQGVMDNLGKFSSTKKWADFMTKLGGRQALDMSELYDQIAFSYFPVGNDSMELNVPVYIPPIARNLIKGKLVKSMREIFEAHCGKGKVDVRFISWGDEDIKKVRGKVMENS